jgi:hypothetical protein
LNTLIEYLYLISGVVLPLFYLPQILRFRNDRTELASYSLSKAMCQFLLRIPALLFAIFVVQNGFMNFVLGLDLLGRAAELAMAANCLRRQGLTGRDVLNRMVPAIWSPGEVDAASAFAALQVDDAAEGSVAAATTTAP